MIRVSVLGIWIPLGLSDLLQNSKFASLRTLTELRLSISNFLRCCHLESTKLLLDAF